MICLLQRVTRASVTINNQIVGSIEQGLLVFAAFESDDEDTQITRMLERLLGYRVFSDDNGKMNLSLVDIHGGLLLVPQFTLAANTRKGMRPSFSSAAAPGKGAELFQSFVERSRQLYTRVETGRFGADMQVALVNDGPVTFWLQV